jgi:hypothetical protein
MLHSRQSLTPVTKDELVRHFEHRGFTGAAARAEMELVWGMFAPMLDAMEDEFDHKDVINQDWGNSPRKT